jgi:MFS family permease
MLFLHRFVPSQNLLSVHNIRWLVLSRFLADLFFYSTTIVLYQHQRGLNFTQMFLMESIISATVWLFDVPTGAWADRFGYRRLMILGRTLNVLGFVLFIFSYGFWLFALSNAIAGLSIACISGCESALVYSSLPEADRPHVATSAFVLLSTASNIGLFAGSLTGSFIGAYSPTVAVTVSIVPAALSLLAVLRLHSHAKSLAHTSSTYGVLRLLRATLYTLRTRPMLVGLSFFDAAAFALINAVFWYNQPYFLRVGIAILWFGPLMATAMGAKILVVLRLPAIRLRLGVRLTLALSCAIPGIAYLLLAFSHTAILTALLVALIVIISSWRAPIVQVELNRLIPDESRATTLSSLSFLGALAGITLNPLIGRVGDLGLEVAGVSLGVGLLAICVLVPFVT